MDPDDPVLATVAFESDAIFLTSGRASATFGRSTSCDIRFGHQPVIDDSVPRIGGTVTYRDGRLLVENLSDRVAFDIKTPDGPLETVRPGAVLGPGAAEFDIIHQGSAEPHRLVVRLLANPRPLRGLRVTPEPSEPPTGARPDLSERQWTVLDAYVEPLRRGGTTPATHREVADLLHWSHATIRTECNGIWAAFEVARVPMRLFRDKRDMVVDAAVRHHLGAERQG